MKCLAIFSATVLFSLVTQSAPVQADADKTVYTKAFSKERKLIVSQKEVPFQPNPSGIKELTPNHVYLYTFNLQTSSGQKLVWQHRLNVVSGTGTPGLPPLFILDASDEGDNLVIVFNDFFEVEANIFSMNLATTKRPFLINWNDATLEVDGGGTNLNTRELNPIVKAAKIEGSYKHRTLVVRLTNSQMRRTRLGTYEQAPNIVTEYRLVGSKWVKGKTVELPPPQAGPVNQGTLNGPR